VPLQPTVQLAVPLSEGDLEGALRGEHKLHAQAVMNLAMKQVAGMKGVVFVGIGGLALLYLAVVFGSSRLTYHLAGIQLPVDDVARKAAMLSVARSPLGLISPLSLALPSALLHMGMANVGLRRALGLPVRIADAFPTRSLGQATVLVLLLNGAYWLLRNLLPGLSLLSSVFGVALAWSYPLLLDRGCSLTQAVRDSLVLTRHNLWPQLGLGVLVYLMGVLSFGLAGIPMPWFLPFAANAAGLAYWSVCGVGPDFAASDGSSSTWPCFGCR